MNSVLVCSLRTRLIAYEIVITRLETVTEIENERENKQSAINVTTCFQFSVHNLVLFFTIYYNIKKIKDETKITRCFDTGSS